MTTQPKLPEWVELEIKENCYSTFEGRLLPKSVMTVAAVRDLASRLLAEIVPEGHVVIPAKQLADLKHIAAYVGLAAVNTPLVPVYQIMADAMRDIPDPGPAAEPYKTERLAAHLAERDAFLAEDKQAEGVIGGSITGAPWPKVDPPGHADYVAGTKEEGGGKCGCDLAHRAPRVCSSFTQGPPTRQFCATKIGGELCGHPRACHEGASHDA